MLLQRNIVIHTGNTAPEYRMGKGWATSFDHTAVVHSVWYLPQVVASESVCNVYFVVLRTMALQMGASLLIEWVPTKENLADYPSRERYGLLREIGECA